MGEGQAVIVGKSQCKLSLSTSSMKYTYVRLGLEIQKLKRSPLCNKINISRCQHHFFQQPAIFRILVQVRVVTEFNLAKLGFFCFCFAKRDIMGVHPRNSLWYCLEKTRGEGKRKEGQEKGGGRRKDEVEEEEGSSNSSLHIKKLFIHHNTLWCLPSISPHPWGKGVLSVICLLRYLPIIIRY